MAIILEGNWQTGRAYDLHTVSSSHLGTDGHGHDLFDTKRSEMGELVYQLKYKSDKKVVQKIVSLLDSISGIEGFDFLVPIPSTKKNRPFQPVALITDELGRHRSVAVLPDLLQNTGDEELKGVADPVARGELLAKAIKITQAK